MRVVLLCADPGVPLGGPKGCSVHLRELAAALLRQGHAVEGLVANLGCGSGPGSFSAGLPRRSLAAPFDLETYLAGAAPDLVIERLSLLAPQGARACAKLGLRHVYEINAPLEQEAAAHRGFRRADEARRDFAEGFRCSTGAVAVSQEVATWVRGLAPPDYPLQVLENGAAPDFFETPDVEAVESARRMLKLPHGSFVVGFAGSFRSWHDLGGLVRAVALLRRRTDARLLLIGDGPQRNEVLREATKLEVPLAITGLRPLGEVAVLLALCDAVAVPYRSAQSYFSPLKLFEAMAAGRAVVASATGPCARVVRHHQNGLLVPPGDDVAMAAAFELLANDPGLRGRLGAVAHREAAGRRTWDRVAERLLDFVAGIPARSAGRPAGAPLSGGT